MNVEAMTDSFFTQLWRNIPLDNQRRFQYAQFQLAAAIAHYVHGSGDAFKTSIGWMRGPYPAPETGEQQ